MTESRKELAPECYLEVSDGKEVWTGWLDPCIGILCIDGVKNSAHVAHIRDVYLNNQQLSNFLAVARLSVREKVKVVVRGAHNWANTSADSREYMDQRRNLLISMVKKAGFSEQEIDVLWGNDDCISNLGYNSTQGVVLFEEVKQER